MPRDWSDLAAMLAPGAYNAEPGPTTSNVGIQRSYPADDHTWLVRAAATSGAPAWQLTGVAMCAN
jgi:hypothetical protein